MNNLDLNKLDYLEVKGNAKSLSEAIREKQYEVADLEDEISRAQNALQELQEELKTASRDMATGRLSTDRFLDLKHGINQRSEDLAALKEALDAQKKSIDFINADLVANKRNHNTLFKKTSEDLTRQLADEIVALAGDPFKNMVHTLVASRGTRTAFKLQEQQRAREAIYLAVGKELCKRAFPAAGGSLNFVPDYFEARKHVDSLIDRSDLIPEQQ